MLARFTASAPQFYVFREFRYLQSRVLLHLQDEIRALETQLFRMDEKDRVNDPHNLECRELDDTLNGRRKIMIDRIQHKLVQYGGWPMQLGATKYLWRSHTDQMRGRRASLLVKQTGRP